MTSLHLLSGGAAQGLVTQLQDRFQAQHGCSIKASFGAVGVMKDSLLAGSPCDAIILTEALIAQLTASGDVMAGSARALGVVKTGIARKDGDAPVLVSSPAALKAALQAARGIYFPDPIKATAGIHFMNVLKQLWGRQGAVPMVMTPDAFDKYARDDIAKWARVIKAGNIKVD